MYICENVTFSEVCLSIRTLSRVKFPARIRVASVSPVQEQNSHSIEL